MQYAPAAQAVISMGNKKQGVRESVVAVRTALNAHGRKF